MNVKSHTFRGKKWRVRVRKHPAKDHYAKIDHPETKNKAIWVNPKLSGFVRLRSLLHEAWHAVDWDLDEDAVIENAECVARFLWRMGYRSKDELAGELVRDRKNHRRC